MAAPIFAQVARRLFDHLNIPPDALRNPNTSGPPLDENGTDNASLEEEATGDEVIESDMTTGDGTDSDATGGN